MEGEKEEEDESGQTVAQANIHTEETEELEEQTDQSDPTAQTEAAEPSQSEEIETETATGGERDSLEQQDVCVDDAEILPLETLPLETSPPETPAENDTERLSQCLSSPPEGDTTESQTTVHPSTIQDPSAQPCWYCLRSRPTEEKTEPQQESEPGSPTPSGGQMVKYQTDPRPHFGVACSSRAPPLPLWGSEGPRWELRDQELPDQTHTCSHCHLGLPPDTLLWHEAKCLLFDGEKSTENK
ncbi:protein TANC2-like isoform X2 [Osmerus eperlanus]|uniref:protein TANC2-like isoform X2 n=1 Tax=Osmerus eperlanus TaxID=29151 RepID=UPI002E115CB1